MGSRGVQWGAWEQGLREGGKEGGGAGGTGFIFHQHEEIVVGRGRGVILTTTLLLLESTAGVSASGSPDTPTYQGGGREGRRFTHLRGSHRCFALGKSYSSSICSSPPHLEQLDLVPRGSNNHHHHYLHHRFRRNG